MQHCVVVPMRRPCARGRRPMPVAPRVRSSLTSRGNGEEPSTACHASRRRSGSCRAQGRRAVRRPHPALNCRLSPVFTALRIAAERATSSALDAWSIQTGTPASRGAAKVACRPGIHRARRRRSRRHRRMRGSEDERERRRVARAPDDDRRALGIGLGPGEAAARSGSVVVARGAAERAAVRLLPPKAPSPGAGRSPAREVGLDRRGRSAYRRARSPDGRRRSAAAWLLPARRSRRTRVTPSAAKTTCSPLAA